MILGQVVGNVVATIKDDQLKGEKLLLVQLMTRNRKPVGRPQAAIDTVEAGEGDIVFLVRARDAAIATYPMQGPVDLAIVGIVERIDTLEDVDLELPFGESYYT